MNVGSRFLSTVRRSSSVLSTKQRESTLNAFSRRQRRLVAWKSYPSCGSVSSRSIFGFSFTPKQKEPKITDGLSAYGMKLPQSDPSDTSDQFNKNPRYLTKDDAKNEYGFYRKVTDAGTREVLNFVMPFRAFRV